MKHQEPSRRIGSGCSPARIRHSDESQRDSVTQPRVARNELPWVVGAKRNNPNGVAASTPKPGATPLGLKSWRISTQGSSSLATLGWQPQSLRDSRNAGLVRLLGGSVVGCDFRKAF